jgi:hypothetical protein
VVYTLGSIVPSNPSRTVPVYPSLSLSLALVGRTWGACVPTRPRGWGGLARTMANGSWLLGVAAPPPRTGCYSQAAQKENAESDLSSAVTAHALFLSGRLARPHSQSAGLPSWLDPYRAVALVHHPHQQKNLARRHRARRLKSAAPVESSRVDGKQCERRRALRNLNRYVFPNLFRKW